MADALEREVKLSAWGGFALPDLGDVVPEVSASPVATRELDAQYYDTADLRLARWGLSLRYRSGDGTGWTVKLPEPDGDADGAIVRRELTFDGGPESVPPEAAGLVAAYARRAPLEPVARLKTVRGGVELRDAEGIRVADVVDDEVSVYEGRRLATRFREVEVELHDGAGRVLRDALVARLRDAGAGDAEPIPKVVRVLGARAMAPPELVPVPLRASSPAGDAVRAAFTASVIRIMRHDPGVRLGDDPEDVHQARVGARRLRSDLRTFAPLLDPAWHDELTEELRWLGGSLGGVRDADVLLERIRERGESLPERDATGMAAVVRRIVKEREAARTRLLEDLAGERYLALLDRLIDDMERLPLLDGAARPAADVLPELVATPWKKLEKAVAALGRDPEDEQLHAVRIRVKRCRYAAEAAAPVVGKQAARFAAALAELQEILGDHQDAAVAEAWLRDAGRRGSAALALVAGELVALERAEAAARRAEWRKAWKRASAKKRRAWLP